MKRILVALVLLWCSPVYAGSMLLLGAGTTTVVGSCTPGTEATAFLARATGLDTPHTTMYCNLINGLVADSVWTKLDVIYFFATDTAAHALLNLKSGSFNGTANGSPTFTANQGYTGVDASSTVWIDTGFNASTAGGNYIQNSAHISAWCNTAVTSGSSGGVVVGVINSANTQPTRIYPRFSDGKSYFSVNESTSNSAGLTLGSTSIGHWVANRSGSGSAEQAYHNAVDVGLTGQVSTTLQNGNIGILAQNKSGTIAQGSANQVSAATIGGSLTATDVTNLYTRLGTARTAVGL